jgi:hypothetical protein
MEDVGAYRLDGSGGTDPSRPARASPDQRLSRFYGASGFRDRHPCATLDSARSGPYDTIDHYLDYR